MSTTTPNPSRTASPLRVLQRLSWRLKSAKAPALATEVMDAALGQQERELVAALDESRAIDAGLTSTRRKMSAALTDPETPGIITEAEARHIAGGMIDLSVTVHTHTERLGAML